MVNVHVHFAAAKSACQSALVINYEAVVSRCFVQSAMKCTWYRSTRVALVGSLAVSKQQRTWMVRTLVVASHKYS